MNKETFLQFTDKYTDLKIINNAAYYEVKNEDIVGVVTNLLAKENVSLKLITATDERSDNKCFRVWYVFGVKTENIFLIPYLKLENTTEFNTIVPVTQMACAYERQIRTFFGLTPIGNPDPRPIILHENWPADVYPLRKDYRWNTKTAEVKGEYQFRKILGDGVYEIPVGPIHAGIIEPGHFRFSVAGEEILNLEAKLGFKHKGSEKLFETLALPEKLKLAEKISGDSSFSHSLAFCQAIEQLVNIEVPERAKYLRVIFAELERIANHLGDIGAIMLDTGFNFGGASGARFREMVLSINEKLTGSRFLRGVNAIGGVSKNIENIEELVKQLNALKKDFLEVIDIAEDDPTLQNRLNTTGELTMEVAKDFGVVGVPARALGIKIDSRVDFAYAAYEKLDFNEIGLDITGDVHARFNVRVKEVLASIELIIKACNELPIGQIKSEKALNFNKDSLAISVVEGWRGEIIYFVTTNKQGEISRVAPRDPSFLNWSAVGFAGLKNIVPDFPLINKSFNLSYSGNDL